VGARAIVMQHKTQRPVQFEITPMTARFVTCVRIIVVDTSLCPDSSRAEPMSVPDSRKYVASKCRNEGNARQRTGRAI
jgi:hypothetical protein